MNILECSKTLKTSSWDMQTNVSVMECHQHFFLGSTHNTSCQLSYTQQLTYSPLVTCFLLEQWFLCSYGTYKRNVIPLIPLLTAIKHCIVLERDAQCNCSLRMLGGNLISQLCGPGR